MKFFSRFSREVEIGEGGWSGTRIGCRGDCSAFILTCYCFEVEGSDENVRERKEGIKWTIQFISYLFAIPPLTRRISSIRSSSLHSTSPPAPTTQANMNPNDFYLRQQPVASTSTSSQPQLDQSTSSTNASSLNQDKPKTQKEIEQEKKDAELAELLEQMDQYKPVVS